MKTEEILINEKNYYNNKVYINQKKNENTRNIDYCKKLYN